MQTERFTILVGPEQSCFRVPEGLLTIHSPVFERMCSGPFLESTQRVIKLPEESPPLFEDFFLWMHSLKPQVDFSMGTKVIFELAIFAEKYQIYHLMNQTTDLIRSEDGRRHLHSEMLDLVYSSVPDGAVLRQVCAWAVEWKIRYSKFSNKIDFNREYSHVISAHTDLGRDFFKYFCAEHAQIPDLCHFHNHSNVPNPAKRKKDGVCPYSDIFVAAQLITPAAAKA